MNDVPTRSRLHWISFYGWRRRRWFFGRRSLDLWSYGQYRRVTGPWWWLYYTLGLQSGEYSPPAPCLDFTAISSAISLCMPVRLRPSESGCHTDYCNWRRSSLSFPTSASRILTSLANAFVKSFTYLFKNGQLEADITYNRVDLLAILTRKPRRLLRHRSLLGWETKERG